MVGRSFVGAGAPLLLALLLISAPAASAAESIGTIKTSTGDAKIIRSGSPEAAMVGFPIRQNDVVATGADGAIGVTFTDSTMLSLGPNTEITVDKYVFDPKANNASFTANMAKGTLQFISGEIAKLSPDAVKINIPTGTIAVRGTRFLVEVGRPVQ
jgi:hypothetical protein